MTPGKLVANIRKLKARRKQLLSGLRLPTLGLPGSLVQSHGRCGSVGCHCHNEGGHLSWTLTYMVERKKRVQHIPNELVETVRVRLGQGQAYKSGVAELMALNAQLLLLERRARRSQEAYGKRRAAR